MKQSSVIILVLILTSTHVFARDFTGRAEVFMYEYTNSIMAENDGSAFINSSGNQCKAEVVIYLWDPDNIMYTNSDTDIGLHSATAEEVLVYSSGKKSGEYYSWAFSSVWENNIRIDLWDDYDSIIVE